MAEQTEQIVLEIDERPSLEATKRANESLDVYEKRAQKANETASRSFSESGETIVRVTDRTRSSIERMVAAAEKKASFAGLTGSEKLAAERDQIIRRLSGEQSAIERVRVSYDKLIAAEEKHVSLGDRIKDAVSNPLQAASQGWEALTTKLGPAGLALGAAAATVGLVTKTLLEMVEVQGKAAEQTVNLSDRLDISVDAAQKLEIGARIAGVSVGALEGSSKLLSAALEDVSGAGEKPLAALAKLGVSTITLQGEQREMGQVLLDVLEKLSKIPVASERVRIANQVLGKGSKELIPFIKNLDSLKALMEKLSVNPQLIQDLADADDKIGSIEGRWNKFKTIIAARVGIPILDALNSVLDRLDNAEIKDALNKANSDSFAQAEALSGRTSASLGQFKIGAAQSRLERRRQMDDERRGAELQQQYANRELKTVDELTAKLTTLKKSRQELDAVLSGKLGRLSGSAYDQRLSEANALDKQIAALEAQKKAIEGAPAAAKEAEQQARREFEQRTSFLRELGKFQDKQLQERVGKISDSIKNEIELTQQAEDQKAKIRVDIFQESESVLRETIRQREDFELRQASVTRDAQLRAIEGTVPRTVEQKVRLEQRKAEIEVAYIEKSNTLQETALENRTKLAIEQKLMEYRIAGATDEQIAAVRYNLEAKLQQDLFELRTNKETAIATARDSAAIRSSQIMAEANQQAFDRIRSGFESLLDQLFSRTKSWGDVMKSILVASLLTPVKQFASALFAALVTGQQVSVGGGSAASPISGGRGLLGLIGLGMGGGTQVFGPGSIVGGPGGTGGFTGPVGSSGGGFGLSSLASYGSGFKGYLSRLGNIGFGPKGGDFGGEVAGSYRGVGGVTGGALLAGGGALAMDGIRRGGLAGLGETTAGGALIGLKFGGPIGALIGGLVGFTVGTVRLFIKGSVEKAVDKVKSLYGLSISKDIGQQIVATAKQAFGGDLDVAVRSPQIRELLELYAMSTGQKWNGAPTQPTPISLYQSGGSLYQAPTYKNGAALPSLGGAIPTISGGTGGNITVVVQSQLPAEAVGDYMQGKMVETIATSPKAVQSASQSATSSSIGRRQASAAMLGAPGLVTS